MRFLHASLRCAFFAIGIAGINFGIPCFLAPQVARATGVIVRAEASEFDWAKLAAHARVVYVSSGPKFTAVRMIDDDLRTLFHFRNSDAHPTVIVELTETQLLHRVGAVFQPGDARVDIYLLDKLPTDPRQLERLPPVVSIVDPDEPGNVSADFAPSSARYVALQWTPKKSGIPLDVAQVSAFSLNRADTPSLELAVSGNQAAIPSAPPVIPVVSPE